jgi:hypothetical protein
MAADLPGARVTVNVRMRTSARDLADELATLDGTSRAEVLRRALGRGLAAVEKEIRATAAARPSEIPT